MTASNAITAASKCIICFVLVVLPLSAGEKVDFSIVGRIQFTVPGEWKVISSKSNAKQTTFAFQIENPADEETPDSTNLVLIAYDLNDDSAKKAYAKRESGRGPAATDAKLVDGWDCSTFSAMQASTSYSDWDCHRRIEGSGVFVRLAWPHLAKNAPDYDVDMKRALAEVLRSVVPYSSPTLPPNAHGS
jgi:hypothetical protein